MKYYSTNNRRHLVSLKEAVIQGMPSDHGLYMPENIPDVDKHFIRNISDFSFHEISFSIAKLLIDNEIPDQILHSIIEDALNFQTPVVELEKGLKILELFHGPTLAFKDVGARFMARVMSYFLRNTKNELNIIVATSGDTGSAVANGFYKVDGINVIILYPSGKISKIQEKQIVTLGENITSLEVDGTFDDCQKLVKKALTDQDIKKSIDLTTANSINISRIIPQTFYYFNAFSQLNEQEKNNLVISVPSGNFGNLFAGILAKKMGLPVYKFIAATNINDVIPEYLKSGIFTPRNSIATISNAMDVGNPSNFVRILDLYKNNYVKIKNDISGYAFDDIETRKAIKKIYEKYEYVTDSHSAIAYLGLLKYLRNHPEISCGIFLETAHPAKFKSIVEKEISTEIQIPARLEKFLEYPKLSKPLKNNFSDLKQLLLSR